MRAVKIRLGTCPLVELGYGCHSYYYSLEPLSFQPHPQQWMSALWPWVPRFVTASVTALLQSTVARSGY